jgi:hypothetical protein
MFSELARSFRDRVGGLFGITGFASVIDFTLAGKYFPTGFFSPKGIEAQDNVQEGIITLSHHLQFLKSGATLIMHGLAEQDSLWYDTRLNAAIAIKHIEAEFQMQWRYTAETTNRSGSRVVLRLTPVKNIFLDLRLEEKYAYAEGLEKGLLGCGELGIQGKRWQTRIRYGFFDTDSYASRIIAYEIDLPGVVNNRVLYGQGQYGFVYMSFRPVTFAKLSLKYTRVTNNSVLAQQFGCQLDLAR